MLAIRHAAVADDINHWSLRFYVLFSNFKLRFGLPVRTGNRQRDRQTGYNR